MISRKSTLEALHMHYVTDKELDINDTVFVKGVKFSRWFPSAVVCSMVGLLSL